MRKKRALAALLALLALCLTLALPGCQGQEEQDAYYASLMAQRAEQLPEEPEPGTWRYLNMEPEPGDTLQGEVVIRGLWEGNCSLLADLSKEFMLQHPAVKITLEWEQSFMDGINASVEESRARETGVPGGAVPHHGHRHRGLRLF